MLHSCSSVYMENENMWVESRNMLETHLSWIHLSVSVQAVLLLLRVLAVRQGSQATGVIAQDSMLDYFIGSP